MSKQKTKEAKAPKKTTKEVPVEAPKKKKKHTGLKVFAILMTIFVVFPIAFVFIAFFDTSTKKVSNSEITYQNIVSKSIASSFDYLHDVDPDDNPDPKIGIYIDEDMVDGIMMSACDMINKKQFIPKMYCHIKGNNYTFYVDLQAAFFKTRVTINSKLDKVVDEELKDSTLTFKITGFKIGRLPIPINWIAGIAGNFIKDSMITEAFSNAGFHIECNFRKLQLTYTRSQFREDVYNYLKKLGNGNEYLDILLNVLGEPGIIETYYEDGVTVAFNLASLIIDDSHHKEIYKEAPLEFKGLEAHRVKVEDLLNNHSLPESDVAKVFTYLMRGHKNSSEEIKQYIENIDPEIEEELKAYLNGTELKAYNGSEIEDIKYQNFTDYCQDNIEWRKIIEYKPDEDPNKVSFCLPSDDLNRVLANKLDGIIGTTIPITFKDGNNWNFEYITVDNIYTGFKPSETGDDNYQFIVYLRLNIDGVPITLAIVSNNIDVTDNTIEQLGYLKFDLKDIYFGIIPIEDKEVMQIVLDLFKQKEGQTESVFVYEHNEEKNIDQLKVSLDNLIPPDSITEQQIAAIYNVVQSCDKPAHNLEESDTFKLTYTLPNP